MMCDPISGERFQDLADLIYWISGRGVAPGSFRTNLVSPTARRGFGHFCPFLAQMPKAGVQFYGHKLHPRKLVPGWSLGGGVGWGAPPKERMMEVA